MEYFGIMPVHKTWVRISVVLIGCYIIFEGITTHKWYEIPVGILIMLCALFWKQYIVSEKGVDVRTNLCGIINHSVWSWDEVTSLRTDYHEASPNVQMHFGKDIVTRTFVLSYDDSQAILELAERMNPDMRIDDMNAERERELAIKARKHVEKLEAEKLKKKAAKRKRK